MRSLTASLQRLADLPAQTQFRATQQVYRDAVMYLLRTDPFYGRVLSQLTLKLRSGSAVLALRAAAHEWQLVVDPGRLAKANWTGPQWLAMLRHTVLHLLWQHPERYAAALKSPHQAALVRWATDAAVNDYLTDLPAQAITSRRLQALVGRPVARRQDSNAYWQVLQRWQRRTQPGHDLPQRGPNDATAGRPVDAATAWDDHQTWTEAPADSALERQQWRQQLFATTAAELSAKQRGTLPGAIRAALAVVPAQRPLNWRALLQRYLGQVPAGRQPAYGRFNRRQPYRMDLPGQVVQTWQEIRVFVDESGSMGNQEIGDLLGQLAGLLALYPASITVYPFDTQVHLTERYQFTGRVHDVQRVGGGGTRFQAVFDALPCLTRQAGQLTIILTDGYGEDHVTGAQSGNLVWLLTSPATQLSVQPAPGVVISLADNPEWQAQREG